MSHIAMLLPGKSVSLFPVMQTDFFEMSEAQFQSITIVSEIILWL